MFGGMASFASNFTKSYQQARDTEYERERQAKEDAWREEQRGWERDRQSKASKLESDLAAAAAPVSVEQPNDVIKDDDGNDMPAVPAFRVGTKRFATMDEATGIAAAQNTPEAVAARQAQAYQSNGKPMDGISMTNAIMDQRLKKLGLTEAEAKFADQEFNRKLNETIGQSPDFWSGAAKVLTDTKAGGIGGVSFRAVPSSDGASVNLVADGGDGQGKPVASFPNTPEGQAAFMQRFAKADITTKITWLNEQARAKAAAEKAGLEERRTAVLERNAATNERKLDGLLLRGMGGSGAGARNGKADEVQQPSMPDPMAGFDGKRAYAVATEQAVAELASSGKPATPDQIAQRATAIYRSLEGEFKKTGLSSLAAQAFAQSARNAATPNDVAALYQQGLSYGMNPAQMVEIDPRMASLANPPKQETQKKETAKPSAPARPLTTFESMRQTKLSDEAAKSKTREQAEKEAREAERQRLLSQRPDLQQMGGMRFFN